MNTQQKERPILFSGPMVRAILEGRKTQTRRIVKPQPPPHAIDVFDWREPEIPESAKANEGCYFDDMDGLHFHCKCPFGSIGDRLWVRETWTPDHKPFYPHFPICYRADFGPDYDRESGKVFPFRWRPSIHMPRWASRINLEIVDVRVERLNDISEEDAICEGVQCAGVPASLTNRGAFAKLWESINGEGSWKVNPWVWVVSFRKI